MSYQDIIGAMEVFGVDAFSGAEDIIGTELGTELAGAEEHMLQLLAGADAPAAAAAAAVQAAAAANPAVVAAAAQHPAVLQAQAAGAHPAVVAAIHKAAVAQAVNKDAGKKAFLQQLALKGAGSAVVSRSATKSRVYSQGFGPADPIEEGETVQIVVQPQVTFKGKRLVIPTKFSDTIIVNDLKIGNVSQLPSSNGLPARAFSPVAVGMQQDFDTAQISQQIVLIVTNVSGADVENFMALLNGIIVQ